MSAFTNKKKEGDAGDEEAHSALLGGRLTEGSEREDVMPPAEDETVFQSAKKKSGQQQGSSSASADGRDMPTHQIGTPLSFYTNPQTAYGDKSLSKKPLVDGMKSKKLSAEEQFNMKGVYIEKAQNNEKFPVGIKIDGVNGESLNHYQDEVGNTFAYALLPGESVAYGTLNNGLGRKLGGRELDEHGQVHIKLSADELKKFATLQNGNAIIDIDFTSYAKSKPAEERTTESMNPLAKVVVANSRALLAKDPRVRKIVGSDLDPADEADKKLQAQFQTFKIDKKPFADNEAQMQVLVDEASLDSMLSLIKKKIAKTAAKTNAKDYTVSVVRLNRKSGPGALYGDIAGEHQVTGRDVDAANAGKTPSGVHVVLNHEIHHPNSKK
jgi:hypothetical protein